MDLISSKEIGQYYDAANKINESSFNESINPDSQKEPPLFGIKFVSELLDVSTTLIYQLIEENSIPFKIVGKNTKKLNPESIQFLRECLFKRNSKKYPFARLNEAIVIGVNSNKGGTGKTSTSVNLAGYLNLYAGRKVLLIDLDAQGTCSSQMGINENIDLMRSSYVLLSPYEDDIPDNISSVIHKTNWHNIDVIPASLELYNVEFEIPVARFNDETFDFWGILASRIERLKSEYDVIIIDSPPSLSFTTINIATASDGLLMPVIPSQASFHSLISYLDMLRQTMDVVEGMVDEEQTGFSFFKIVANQYEEKPNSMSIIAKLQQVFEDNMLLTPIVRSASIEQAVNEFKNIYEIQPKSKETHNRALGSFNAFGKEIDELISEFGQPRLELESD